MSFITSTLKQVITAAIIVPAAAVTSTLAMSSSHINSGLGHAQNLSWLGCPNGWAVVAIIPVKLEPNSTEMDILICKDNNDIWSASLINYSTSMSSMVTTNTSTTSVDIAISTSQSDDMATTGSPSHSGESISPTSSTPTSSTTEMTNTDPTATETFAGVPDTGTSSQASIKSTQQWSLSSGTVYSIMTTTTTTTSSIKSPADTMDTTSTSNQSPSSVASFASFTTSNSGFTAKQRNCTPTAK